MLTLARRARVALAGMLLLAIPAVDVVMGPEKPEVMHAVAAVIGFVLLAVSAKS